jgi:hypothetical protein
VGLGKYLMLRRCICKFQILDRWTRLLGGRRFSVGLNTVSIEGTITGAAEHLPIHGMTLVIVVAGNNKRPVCPFKHESPLSSLSPFCSLLDPIMRASIKLCSYPSTPFRIKGHVQSSLKQCLGGEGRKVKT